MKKLGIAMVTCLFAFALSACSGSDNGSSSSSSDTSNTEKKADNNGDGSSDNQDNGTKNTNQSGKSGMKQKMNDLDYTEFELEVELPNVKNEYELELKKRDDGSIKAKLDDTINNEHYNGKEAFDKIYPKIKNTNITPDTGKKEAIDQALKAFDLPSEYNELELEIDFKNGKSAEFND